MPLPPPMVFDDEPPMAVATNEVYQDELGDILVGNWGRLVQSEDFKANTKDSSGQLLFFDAPCY